MEEAPGHWEPRGKVEQAGGDVSLPGEESGPALRCQVQRPEPRLVSGPQGAAVESRRGGPRGQRTGEEAPRGQPGAGGASRSAECPRAAARRRPWCRGRDGPAAAEGQAAPLAAAGGQGACSRATTAAETRGGRRRGVDCGRAVPKAGDVLAEREAAQQGPLREHRGGLKASSALAWPGWAGVCRGQTGQGEHGGDGTCPQVDDGVRGSGPRCKPGAGRGP